MVNERCCSYIRVSTQKQGRTMLGLEAQREMCKSFAERNKCTIEKEFMDVESGTHRDRKGLWGAIEYCKKNGTSLVIAKLDRLARDVEFTFKVINTGIDIHFVDMPIINSMILGVFASVAQYEREMCSSRTKQALAVKKAQGVRLGASSPKYIETINNKPKIEIEEEYMKRGYTKNTRFLESKETVIFIKILRQVFPKATDGEPLNWKWSKINTHRDNREKVLSLMRDYKETDESGTLFRKWFIDDDEQMMSRVTQMKLNSKINTIKKSFVTAHDNMKTCADLSLTA